MARDHRDGSDRPIAWLFQSCRGKWIFNNDDDEVPSPRLIALLPSLVRRDDLTHCWMSRRWSLPDSAHLPPGMGTPIRYGVSGARFGDGALGVD